MAAAAAARPLLCRVLSFREPLLVIPYLAAFLGAAFFRSYSCLLQSFARSLLPPTVASAAKSLYAAATVASPGLEPCCGKGGGEEEVVEDDEAVVSREEVEEIMERIGLGVSGAGEGLKPWMGHGEVSRLFDADEPSFAEVRRAFAVFDRDGDGLIGEADLQGALARLGLRQDATACRAMLAAASGSGGARMNLCQFVRFLEAGLC